MRDAYFIASGICMVGGLLLVVAGDSYGLVCFMAGVLLWEGGDLLSED